MTQTQHPITARTEWLAFRMRFLEHLAYLAIATGVVMTIVRYVVVGDARLGAIAIFLVGCIMLLMVRLRMTRHVALFACWALLSTSWLNAASGAGLRGISWVTTPVAVMVAAWLLERRASLLIQLTAIASVLVFLLLHQYGLTFTLMESPVVLATALTLATIAAMVLGSSSVWSFNDLVDKLEDTGARLATAQKIAKLGSWSRDLKTGQSAWSAELRRIFGLPDDAHPDLQSLVEHIHPDDASAVFAQWGPAAAGDAPYDGVFRIVVRGQIKWIRNIIELERDADDKPTHISATFQDITQLKSASEQVEFLAFHDELTGLPNRRLGLSQLARAIRENPDPADTLDVLYVDFDNFKYINDRNGHIRGDQLIKNAALRLKSLVTRHDQICRLSGDEFMIVLRCAAKRGGASQVCDALLETMSEPFNLDGQIVSITVSVGVASYPKDGETAEELMSHADMAMYQAKKTGRNRVHFFTENIGADFIDNIQTIDALRLGIDRDEFQVYYQPKLALRSGKLTGVEALVRWNRSDKGLVTPDSFVAVAEESRLMVAIGGLVLRDACKQMAAWHAAGFNDLKIAVNLSLSQVMHTEMEEEIRAALHLHGLHPSMLELELLESWRLEEDDTVIGRIERLHELGIRISIDDFGTGYSSLGKLRLLQADKLKIDRSFIKDLCTRQESRRLVGAVIRIARSLNLRTIAEGIEDAPTAAILARLGVDEGQGYYFCRPMPARELEAWMVNYTAQTSEHAKIA
jgi:diguanylate cyclase (GGDEF)-like protein